MHRKLIGGLFVLALIAVVPVVSAQWRNTPGSAADIKAPSDAPAATLPAPYKIQPNDTLEVFVWKEPDLTRKVIVRPDGRISFPLIQDMPASGVSPAELKEEIEKKLKEFLDAPNVTVMVEAIQSYRIFITGRVAKPGAVSIERPITVLQAVALAGGFQEFANSSEITILSTSDGKNSLARFSYPDVIKGKNLDQNILLKSGDVVNVP